jgi:hypothetical protein
MNAKSDVLEKSQMADPNIAFARAWNLYLLTNEGVDENDERRATLERFIRKQCDARAEDTEMLVVAALKYLKDLDQSGAVSLE